MVDNFKSLNKMDSNQIYFTPDFIKKNLYITKEMLDDGVKNKDITAPIIINIKHKKKRKQIYYLKNEIVDFASKIEPNAKLKDAANLKQLKKVIEKKRARLLVVDKQITQLESYEISISNEINTLKDFLSNNVKVKKERKRKGR